MFRRSLIRNAIVSLSSDGTVTDVSVCDDMDSQAGVEFYSGILLPDMVNAHCHLELSYMKGRIPPGGGFTAFAKGMGTARTGVTPEQRVAAAEDADAALWCQGVGAVGDVCNGDSTFALKRRSRIGYTNFLELFGMNTVSADTLSELEREAAGMGLRAGITPHSTYSLRDGAFVSAVRTGTDSVPLSVHFMESPSEKELFEGRGEMHEWYVERGTPIDFGRYRTPAGRIAACVPAARDILLVHDCCVTEEDVDTVMRHFTGRVTWVLCPRSNRYISGLVPPVELLRGKGVNIAIGTDSLASNESLSMIDELKALRGVPLEEALTWVTEGGAASLGIDDRIGVFEPGRRSGAVLLEGVDMEHMELTANSRTRRIL